MKRLSLLLIILLLVYPKHSNAQQTYLSFDHLTERTGLPESQITDLMQDNLGYIWMGTQNGLVRYDGYQIKVYKLGIGDKSNFPEYTVANIITDKYHNIWVASSMNGFFKYNRQTDTFVQYKRNGQTSQFNAKIDSTGNMWSLTSFSNNNNATAVQKFNPATGAYTMFGKKQKGKHFINIKVIFTIDIGKSGTVRLGTENGIYNYNPATDTFKGYLNSADTALQKTVSDIYEEPANPKMLWLSVGHVKGKRILTRFNFYDNSIMYFAHNAKDKNSLINDTVLVKYQDKNNRIWLGTMQGLSLYNPGTNRFTNYTVNDTLKNVNKNTIIQIKEDKKGNLWMAGYGLIYFNPQTGQYKRYAHQKDDPSSLNARYIEKLIFDNTGTLWAGLSFGGTDRVNTEKSAFQFLSGTQNRFPWHGITAVAQAPGGKCWVAANNGLFEYDELQQSFNKVTLPDQKISINCIFNAKNGDVYLGTNVGLNVYHPDTHKSNWYKTSRDDINTLSNNIVSSILEDHTGTIWVGTSGGGICALTPKTKKFKQYPFIYNQNNTVSGNMLDDDEVATIFEDHTGTIWVGTNNGGLNRFDRKKNVFISSYDPHDGTGCVTGIVEDKQNRLWISTYLNGLFMVNNRTGRPLKRFTEDNGLLNNSIIKLLPGYDDNLWMITKRGFCKINIATHAIKNYPSGNNIWANMLEKNSLYWSFQNSKGNIIIGDEDNILSVNPRLITQDNTPPIVHIETLGYSNPRATTDNNITIQTYQRHNIGLLYNQNKIAISYVGLQYTNPQENRYAYKLDGFDKHWVQAGTTRNVTYTNLPIGTYTFHVKAANSSGVWNNTGDSIIIVIHPPWWFTWWMRLTYLALFALFIYGIIRYRSRKLKRENLLLEEKIVLRTHQLSEANKELSEQQEEITTQRDRLAETIDGLKAAQTQLIQSEKLASLGELTAGIAHEIQNPLNFVNNFSEVNTELIDEMQQEIDKGDYEEVKAIANDIKENQQKISQHGKRADFIVKGMLQHSRTSTGERQPTNINALADEFFKLSYHGLRAKDKSFNADMVINFDANLPKVNIVQQDIGRVLLNLFNNAFYAVNQKKGTAGADYKPTVTVSTFAPPSGGWGASVRDNGNGIPDAIKEKILQPFFTTKPTGEGTGLGLSLSYDIVVKGHGGSIDIETVAGEYSEFIIKLPA